MVRESWFEQDGVSPPMLFQWQNYSAERKRKREKQQWRLRKTETFGKPCKEDGF